MYKALFQFNLKIKFQTKIYHLKYVFDLKKKNIFFSDSIN